MPSPKRIILYLATGFSSLFIFIVILFPYDSIRTRLVQEIERGFGGDYIVTIERLRLNSISGVSLRNIIVRDRVESVELLRIPKAAIELQLLPLLWGTLKGAVHVNLGKGDSPKGELKGSLAVRADSYRLRFNIKDLNIGDVPFLREKYRLNLSSQIRGEGDLELFTREPIRNSGHVTLTLKELSVAESEIQFGEGETAVPFKLPNLKLAQADKASLLSVRLEKGKLEVDDFKLVGGDLEIDLTGKVYLARNAGNSRLSLQGHFGLSKDAAEALPVLFLIEKEKGADGKYPLSVSGRMAKPSVRVGMTALPL